MRILVSGFEPFLDEKVNPTEVIANFANSKDLLGDSVQFGSEPLEVRGIVLPVLFEMAYLRLEEERRRFAPDVVVCFGLAGGREAFEVEQVAVNICSGSQTSRGDNRGVTPSGPIDPNGALSISTTLPSDRLIEALTNGQIPARKSFSAGTYVCNDLFYRLQDRLRFTRVLGGFIHVPRMTDDKGAWPRAKFEKATTLIVAELARIPRRIVQF